MNPAHASLPSPWSLAAATPRRERRRDLTTAFAVAALAHAALLLAQPTRPPSPPAVTETPTDSFTCVVREEPPVVDVTQDEPRNERGNGGGAESITFDPSELVNHPRAIEIQIDTRQISISPRNHPEITSWTYNPFNPVNGPGVGEPGGPRVYDVVSLDRIPEAVVRVAPQFPPSAKASSPTAMARAQFVVTADGKVVAIEVVEASHPDLERAVVRALEHWSFKPGWRKNQKVATRMEQVFHFSLND